MEGTLEDGSIAISPGEEGSYKIGFHDDLFRGTVVIRAIEHIFSIFSLLTRGRETHKNLSKVS